MPLRESVFLIDDERFYTTNATSVDKEDWKKLTDDSSSTEEIDLYVSEDYTIHHEFDSNGNLFLIPAERQGTEKGKNDERAIIFQRDQVL